MNLMKFFASEDSHAAVETGLMTAVVASRRTMLSIANEAKRRSLPEETGPFVGLHSDFLKNQNISLGGSKMLESTPTPGRSANIQGSDSKRTRIGRFADATPFVWIKAEQRVNLRFSLAPNGTEEFTVLARITNFFPSQPKF